jgi:hypothetical protein
MRVVTGEIVFASVTQSDAFLITKFIINSGGATNLEPRKKLRVIDNARGPHRFNRLKAEAGQFGFEIQKRDFFL